MNDFWVATRKFLRNEEGVTAIEYALIAALLALAIIVGVTAVGAQLNSFFNKIAACLKSPHTACTGF